MFKYLVPSFLTILVAPTPAPDPRLTPNEMMAEVRAQRHALDRGLRSTEIWTDRKNAQSLRELLTLAGEIGVDPKTIPLLVARIDHEPEGPVANTAIRPPEEKYPALGVLIRVGPEAVPALMQAIASTKYQANDPAANHTRQLYIYTIATIYKKFGESIQTVRQRLKAEAAARGGTEGSNILSAFEHPLLAK